MESWQLRSSHQQEGTVSRGYHVSKGGGVLWSSSYQQGVLAMESFIPVRECSTVVLKGGSVQVFVSVGGASNRGLHTGEGVQGRTSCQYCVCDILGTRSTPGTCRHFEMQICWMAKIIP